MKNYLNQKEKKQKRKPIGNNFAPKRLAINFEPPMIIMEYLVVDTGKLYHHKMRLDSVMKVPNVSRDDILNYIKTKHHLYFVGGQVSNEQLYKFIDKILLRCGKITKETYKNNLTLEPNLKNQSDFYYLNQDEEYYEEDYEDYEEGTQKPVQNQVDKQKVRNAYLQYCRKYEEQEEESAQASWDLDMDDADYV